VNLLAASGGTYVATPLTFVQLFLIDLHSINVPFFIAIKEKPAFVIFPGNYFLHYLYPFFIPEIEKISDHDWRLLIKKAKGKSFAGQQIALRWIAGKAALIGID